MIIAGEESGEIYGARLIRELRRFLPDAEFSGVGGDRMAAERFRILYHCSEMASIGVVQMMQKIFFLLGALNDIRERVGRREYDAVILIDYPDFNLRVAKAASDAGVPVFYYVCPQFWAWRRYRIRSVRRWVDTMMVILPFEEEFYKERNVNALFIGHPMLDEMTVRESTPGIKAKFLTQNSDTLIGLLPGSRTSEVSGMLSRLLETADIIHADIPSTGFVIALAPHIPPEPVKEAVGGRDFVKVVQGESHSIMEASDLLITKSGTSTLEAAIIGTPMIIVYRVSFFSYWLARLLSHVDRVGLPNLIAGREIAPEYLQHGFRPERVAAAALELLKDTAKMDKARKGMLEVRQKLGEQGAPARAAKIITDRLSTRGITTGQDR